MLDVRDISSPLMGATYLETGGEHSPIGDSSEGSLPCEYKPSTIPATSSSQSISNEAKCVVQHSNQFLATDLQCAVCKCLLCRPIVLNCGHGKSVQISYISEIVIIIIFDPYTQVRQK